MAACPEWYLQLVVGILINAHLPSKTKFLVYLTEDQGQISTYTVEDVEWSVSLVLLSVFGVCDDYTSRNNLRHTQPLTFCGCLLLRILAYPENPAPRVLINRLRHTS